MPSSPGFINTHRVFAVVGHGAGETVEALGTFPGRGDYLHPGILPDYPHQTDARGYVVSHSLGAWSGSGVRRGLG
ncbi:hypothetical protein ACQPWR_21970 [Micromonospora vinacea]|uniref:hypothetical protein n=1 Tax=Micromonospora vinacea TaxID=709878 RepID=UPI003D92B9CD